MRNISDMNKLSKIVLPGGAGLVGQNLVVSLKKLGYSNIVVLDKHKKNTEVLKLYHNDIVVECVDLAEEGGWGKHFEGAEAVVMLQAQIGDLNLDPFIRNNLTSTKNIINYIKKYQIPYLVHISSSVVNSIVQDNYVDTKKEQEKIVSTSDLKCVILRPTLMFGWFDRKHLGWLARFMKKTPIFPVPGNGKFMRQPLYVGDFCRIIINCIENRREGTYDITGLEKIDYIDIIKQIKVATKAKSQVVKIPYFLFYTLLKIWSVFDKAPPFTTSQLKALVADDEFKEIDWPCIFEVNQTPFKDAIHATFNDPKYSAVKLDF